MPTGIISSTEGDSLDSRAASFSTSVFTPLTPPSCDRPELTAGVPAQPVAIGQTAPGTCQFSTRRAR